MYLVIVLTCLAKSANMTIYSIDAYNTGVGGQAKTDDDSIYGKYGYRKVFL